MNTNEERSLSSNWTGSCIENPLEGDWYPEWRGDIVYISGSNIPLEGTYEASAFSASAAYICQNGGDILQIGYGMCQAANYIQSHSIDNHTIIIDQQGAYDHAVEWAKGKSNVTIITGSFYEKDLQQYDGVFINKTKLLFCNHATANSKIKSEIPKFTKTGSLVSWYNYCSDTNMLNIEDVEYEVIKYDYTIPSEAILQLSDDYYMPKMEIS